MIHIALTDKEALEKRTFARRITIKGKGKEFTGTIIFDRGRKNFLGLCDDKETLIFGEIESVKNKEEKTIERTIYFTVEYKSGERINYFEELPGNSDLELDEKDDISLEPITNISQREIDEIRNAYSFIKITKVSNHIKKITCKNASSIDFTDFTKKIAKKRLETKLYHVEKRISKDSRAVINFHDLKFGFPISELFGEDNDEKYPEVVVYSICIKNSIYAIGFNDKKIGINKYTFHDKYHPFAFNGLWEENTTDFLEGKRHTSDLVGKEKWFHCDQVCFRLNKDLSDFSGQCSKHTLFGSSPYHSYFKKYHLKSLDKLEEWKKLETGVILMRLQELKEDLMKVDGLKDIFSFELFDQALGWAFETQLVKDVKAINELCNLGASYEEAIKSVVSARKIIIKDKEKIIEGTVLLDDSREKFIGICDDKNTLISGNLISDDNIVISLYNQEVKTVYNGKLIEGEIKGFEEESSIPVSISITPILGFEEKKADRIRRKFNKAKQKVYN